MISFGAAQWCFGLIITARLAKRAKVMFSLCVSVHRGGSQGPIFSGGGGAGAGGGPKVQYFWGGPGLGGSQGPIFSGGPAPAPTPSPHLLEKKFFFFWENGDTKNGDTKSGGAGGTPLAVTQEDCLVKFVVSSGKIKRCALNI